MAMSFRNCLGSFALIAALMLWAGCNDVDKNADKSSEQEHAVFEFPMDSKYVTLKIPFRPIQFQDSLFDANGVSIQVFKDYSVEGGLVYNDDVEKIAQIIRKESKSIYEIFDSFYKKDVCNEVYGMSLSLNVSIGRNGFVEEAEYSHSSYADVSFKKKIVEYVKQMRFEGVGQNNILLSINFCRPFIDADDFNALLHYLQRTEYTEYSIRKSNGAVSAPVGDELKLADDVEHDKYSVLKVIRQRTPGLRHIYNKHLKKNRVKSCLKNNHDDIKPDFNGMIVFKLNVNADGSVQKAEIQSSNTGNKDFDDEVKRALSHWKFPKLKSSEVVIFPLVFFENSTPYKNPTYPEIFI